MDQGDITPTNACRTSIMTVLATDRINPAVKYHGSEVVPCHRHAGYRRNVLPTLSRCIKIVYVVIIYITTRLTIQPAKPVNCVVYDSGTTCGYSLRHVWARSPLSSVKVVYPDIVSYTTRMVSDSAPNNPDFVTMSHDTVMRDCCPLRNRGCTDDRPLTCACVEFLNGCFGTKTIPKPIEHV